MKCQRQVQLWTNTEHFSPNMCVGVIQLGVESTKFQVFLLETNGLQGQSISAWVLTEDQDLKRAWSADTR